MASQFFSYCRFHAVRLLRLERVMFVALAAVAIAVVVASGAYVAQRYQAGLNEQQVQELTVARRATSMKAKAAQPPIGAPADLPPFDSAHLVRVLNDVAADVGMPLDEVAYTLDDGATQPYLRYRVMLSVESTYPVIRKFSRGVAATLTNVALDEINCAREDIAVKALSCDLAFSVFYARGEHG